VPGLVIGAVGLRPKLLGPVEGGGGRSEGRWRGGGGSEGRIWLVNATMMNVHMVNEIEGYLQLGRQNADNLGLTELLSSSLSSSPVVARLCLGCKAYVHRKVVRRIDSFLPTNRLGFDLEYNQSNQDMALSDLTNCDLPP
jgi:hypothetical protein